MRAKLAWDVSDSVDFMLSVDHVESAREFGAHGTGCGFSQHARAHSGLYNACTAGVGPPICTNVAGVGDLTGRTPYGPQFLTGNRSHKLRQLRLGHFHRHEGATGTLTWDITDEIAFKSISAWRELDSAFGEDADMSPLVIDHHGFAMDQWQVSQEFQLTGNSSRLDWAAGLYYFRESGGIHDLVPLGAGLLQVDGPNSLRNVSSAAFGQLTYRIVDAWSVTLGARCTEEDKEFYRRAARSQRTGVQPGLAAVATPRPHRSDALLPARPARAGLLEYFHPGGNGVSIHRRFVRVLILCGRVQVGRMGHAAHAVHGSSCPASGQSSPKPTRSA